MTGRGGAKREIRDQQRLWLRQVIERTRKSASQLAVDAGLADVTLTRFLNRDDYDGTLSPLTVRLLVEHTGLPGPGDSENMSRPFGFEEGHPFDLEKAGTSAPMLRDIVARMLVDCPHCNPWEIQTNALEAVGYLPGDVVLVDLGTPAQTGDAVCAEVYDRAGGTETVFRVYEPPVLSGAALNPSERPRPMIVDNVTVKIRGIITNSVRLGRPNRPRHRFT